MFELSLILLKAVIAGFDCGGPKSGVDGCGRLAHGSIARLTSRQSIRLRSRALIAQLPRICQRYTAIEVGTKKGHCAGPWDTSLLVIGGSVLDLCSEGHAPLLHQVIDWVRLRNALLQYNFRTIAVAYAWTCCLRVAALLDLARLALVGRSLIHLSHNDFPCNVTSASWYFFDWLHFVDVSMNLNGGGGFNLLNLCSMEFSGLEKNLST